MSASPHLSKDIPGDTTVTHKDQHDSCTSGPQHPRLTEVRRGPQGVSYWPPESGPDYDKRMQAEWWRRTIMMRERSRQKARVVAQLHQMDHWLGTLLTKEATDLEPKDLRSIQAQLPDRSSLSKLQRDDMHKLISLVKQARKSSAPGVAALSRTIIFGWKSPSMHSPQVCRA